MYNSTPEATPIERVLDFVDFVLSIVLALMAFAIFVVLLMQVGMRYLFSTPLYWVEEMARYLMIYITCIGAAVAYRHYIHPRLRIVIALIPGDTVMWYDLVLRIPVAVFFYYLATVGWGYALANEWMSTPGMQISFFWPFFAVPLGAAFVLLYLALDAINILVYRRSWLLEPDDDGFEEIDPDSLKSLESLS